MRSDSRGEPHTPPTTEQQDALSVSGASVGLISGAGCGKTRVLTDRFLKALAPLETHALPAVLTLTFTEKAARELRERVRRGCRARLSAGDTTADWLAILRTLESAHVSTFHEFCGAVLRGFPRESNTEPRFRIIDAPRARELRERALDRCLRSWLLAGSSDLRSLAIKGGLQMVRQTIDDLISARSGRDYSRWARLSRDEMTDLWRANRDSVLPGVIQQHLCNRSVRPLERLQADDCKDPAFRKRLEGIRDEFTKALPTSGLKDRLGSLRALVEVSGNKSAFWDSSKRREDVTKAIGNLRELIDECINTLAWDQPSIQTEIDAAQQLSRLTVEAIEEYQSVKQSEAVLDFDDLQMRVLTMLKNGSSELLATIQGAIGLILVDEFQDTDPTQAEIVELLAEDALTSGRVFLVGDVKQCIYAFRNAHPELLGQFRTRFPEPGRKQLTENFRSEPDLVHFANALFSGVFTDDADRMKPARTGSRTGDEPCITLVRFDSAGDADANRDNEARGLARLIRDRLDRGWMIRDPSTNEPRRAHAGDIAMLFRSINDTPAFERALQEAGIDYYLFGGGAFYAQQEVLDLINLLSSIEDPTDDVALAGLLRSPCFGISDDALFWVAQANGSTLNERLYADTMIANIRPHDRERVARARSLLTRWRAHKDSAGIARVLETALDESGYETALLAEHLGARKRANCRKLVRLARAFDDEGGRVLGDFVARLKRDFRDPPREEQAATTEELGQSIRLMTVHQAKGLEFPIVVLPRLGRGKGGKHRVVLYSPRFGPLIKCQRMQVATETEYEDEESSPGNSIFWVESQLQAQREHEEELRIFYVAVTRARDSLVLSTTIGTKPSASTPLMNLIAERLDLGNGTWLPGLHPALPTPRVHLEDGNALTAPDGTPTASKRRGQPLRLAAFLNREVRRHSRMTPAPSAAGVADWIALPRWFDLKPTQIANPRHASITALILATLQVASDTNRHGRDLSACIEAAARTLTPSPNSAILSEARTRLEAWWNSLQSAPLIPCERQIAPLPWCVRVSIGEGEAGRPRATAVVEGQSDLVREYTGGEVRHWVVALSDYDPEASLLSRLRAHLADRGAESAVISHFQIVVLDPSGGFTTEEVRALNDESIARDLRELGRLMQYRH